jgi:NAD(P)H-quinone oxidoreductase subunit 5
LDHLSLPFALLSLVLCVTIGSFATRYMHRDPGFFRFFLLYSVFVLGMVTASLADTIETLFFGWELVGLSSALLIGFFQDRPARLVMVCGSGSFTASLMRPCFWLPLLCTT